MYLLEEIPVSGLRNAEQKIPPSPWFGEEPLKILTTIWITGPSYQGRSPETMVLSPE